MDGTEGRVELDMTPLGRTLFTGEGCGLVERKSAADNNTTLGITQILRNCLVSCQRLRVCSYSASLTLRSSEQ